MLWWHSQPMCGINKIIMLCQHSQPVCGTNKIIMPCFSHYVPLNSCKVSRKSLEPSISKKNSKLFKTLFCSLCPQTMGKPELLALIWANLDFFFKNPKTSISLYYYCKSSYKVSRKSLEPFSRCVTRDV